jgi:hypothetical protein
VARRQIRYRRYVTMETFWMTQWGYCCVLCSCKCWQCATGLQTNTVVKVTEGWGLGYFLKFIILDFIITEDKTNMQNTILVFDFL